ncbi:MAG: DUF5659 domain-containing protein [Patescibacteria group bacterium]
MKNQSKDEYLTKDLGESAALLCNSIKLIRLQKEGSFYWFVFADKLTCEQISSQYWAGDLTVFAKDYYDKMRSLKDRLFANKEGRL